MFFPFGAIILRHSFCNVLDSSRRLSILHQYSDCGLSPHTVMKFDAGLIRDLEQVVGGIPEVLALFIQRKQVVAQRRDV